MDICMLTKLLPWPLGWLMQVVLGLVGDSERADTFTAVGIPQCVVWSGRVAGIVLLPPCFFCPPLCPQNRKKTALVYLSWRKKNGMKRLHIWSDLTNKSASHLLGLSHKMAQSNCRSHSQPWTVLRFEIAQWLHINSDPACPLFITAEDKEGEVKISKKR